MKLIVNPHKIDLIKEEAVNEKEINISKCTFEFSEEYGDNLVKEAYFTLEGNTYKKIIVNNECSYPPEVLNKEGTVELGVVAYEVQDEEYIERFNPSPVYFQTIIGSLKDHAENSEEITPSEMEQFEQALEDGLAEVANVDIDASKSGNTATVSITNRNGVTKTVEIHDGEQGEDGEPGITPNIQVGTTTTLPAGSNATVTQRGTTENPIFDFGIPKGKDGSGGGTSDYTNLENKPSINNITLVGNKTSGDLSLQDALVSGTNIKTINNTNLLGSGDLKIAEGVPVLDINNNEENRNKMSDFINKNKNTYVSVIAKYSGDTNKTHPILTTYIAGYENNSNVSYSFQNAGSLSAYQSGYTYYFSTAGNWVNGVFTCTNISVSSTEDYLALATSNTKSYTPSHKNNPATKGYVDDAIAGASTSVDIDGSSITKNSDDELQTVGIIDNNNGNTNKIWTGTLAQYNAIQNKDADTFYYITDDDATSTIRQKVEVITSSDTSYTIANLTANKSYKLSELTALTITACETFDEESVIYFDSGNTATVYG